MNPVHESEYIEKIETGIPGFDVLAQGGLPKGRTTFVIGTPGSGKTIFACQYLVAGIHQGQGGVFVTFEEPPQSIRKNMRSFGWTIGEWEQQGKWIFVDASRDNHNQPFVSGEYDFSPLIARIKYAVEQVKAQRVSIDSLGTIYSYVPNTAQIRFDLFNLGIALRDLGVTSVLTAERNFESDDIIQHSVEEFVADNVVILRNVLSEEKRRRTIEILKFRGASHQEGEVPFSITSQQGLVVLPCLTNTSSKAISNHRVTSGNDALDGICRGGLFQNSVILVSGATGTGKTLMATQFIAGGARNGERCLFFAYEEGREQLLRNAKGWGIDFETLEHQGKLRIVCDLPEARGLESHLVKIRENLEDFQPQRFAIDSISALEMIAPKRGIREFIVTLNYLLKNQGVTALYNLNTTRLSDNALVTESNLSTMTDMIFLLRYVEVFGEIRRGIAILKMRGSSHDQQIREFHIDHQGMKLGQPFRNVSGILTGNPTVVSRNEIERLGDLLRGTE